jgi:hypothetical protein
MSRLASTKLGASLFRRLDETDVVDEAIEELQNFGICAESGVCLAFCGGCTPQSLDLFSACTLQRTRDVFESTNRVMWIQRSVVDELEICSRGYD